MSERIPGRHEATSHDPGTRKVAVLTGPGITDRFGMEGTDLGISTRTPSGRTLAIFGDTYAGAGVGAPGPWHPGRGQCRPTTADDGHADWRSPVGLYSEDTDAAALARGLRWTAAAGPGPEDYAGQLLDYVHGEGCSTILPGDVLTLDGTMYLQVMVNQGLGNVTGVTIHRSDDDGRTWQPTAFHLHPRAEGGFRQLWTWADGGDGWVYAFSTGFQRDKGLILMRVPRDRLLEASEWETWGHAAGAWGWGNPTTVVLPGRIGEHYLRRCGDFWALTFFDAEHYRIDCISLAHPTDDLVGARRTTLVAGAAWGDESDGTDPTRGPARVAQLYCGCPLPGSTPEAWHTVVSQWNTDDSPAGPAGWPYRSLQFVSSVPQPFAGGEAR